MIIFHLMISKLADHCQNIGIDFASTPFDSESVNYLEKIVPYYKIASSDITCKPLLEEIEAKKPLYFY